jgi:hypothetical protein
MRPHPRRARTNPSSPRAWATSDRSGFVGNHQNLRWQMEWAGTGLINKHVAVYDDEYDIPNRQLGTIILPPDPAPISNARVEQYAIDEAWPVLYEGSTEYFEGPIWLERSTIRNQPNEIMALSLETGTIK